MVEKFKMVTIERTHRGGKGIYSKKAQEADLVISLKDDVYDLLYLSEKFRNSLCYESLAELLDKEFGSDSWALSTGDFWGNFTHRLESLSIEAIALQELIFKSGWIKEC